MNTRGYAAQVLHRVLHDGQSLTAALAAVLPKLHEAQDQAFVQALAFGVIRYYAELDCLLRQLLDKPLKAKDGDIRALLLVGLYQLLHMRVKPHAAVAETVAATKHKPWAKGLVNAVLRNAQRRSDQLLQACQASEAVRFNHPQWIIEHLRQDWPQDYTHLLEANNCPAPMVLRVNVRRISAEAYLQLLQAQGHAAELSEVCASAIQLDQAMDARQLPGFADGLVSVQDVAAQLAAQLLDVQPGHRVLDLCAAPGGKTAAILELQPQLAELLAVDVDAERMRRVADNLQRLQLQAQLVVADGAEWDAQGGFDRILLDAPCSGLGVIRRHPDIKWLRRASDIENLQTQQQRLLQRAWQLLAPGGVMLYATCSVLKRENQQQIEDFLVRHADAEEWAIDAEWGRRCMPGRQVFTGVLQMDGFYYARLRKHGG
jgi:16S rRNA (cytosine967-C5)-methyltransferase